MNKAIMMGRLTADPEVRESRGKDPITISNFRIAVNRPFAREDDDVKADFFSCTAFGRKAEFVEEFLRQGIKVVVTGRMQNNDYTNRDGDKVYSTNLIVEDIEFAESKKASEERSRRDEDYEDRGGSGRRSGRSGDREDDDEDRRSSRRDSRDQDRGRGSRRRDDEYADDRGESRRSSSREERSRRDDRGDDGRGSRSRESSRRRRDADDEFMDMDKADADELLFT